MVTLIEHVGYKVKDKPEIPWVLEATLRPPELMQFAFLMLHGNEYVKVRADSEEELQAWAELNGIPNHPRLIRMRIYKP